MNESVSMQDENSINDRKVNKRRSAVFTRQSIVPKVQDFEISKEVSQESKKFKQCEEESKSFVIKKYLKNLEEEDSKWRETYAKRKSRVQELKKCNKSQEQTLDITALSDSERAFLKTRPDYEEFNKNVFQLHLLATKVAFFRLSAKHFCEKSVTKLENEKDSVKNQIISLSD